MMLSRVQEEVLKSLETPGSFLREGSRVDLCTQDAPYKRRIGRGTWKALKDYGLITCARPQDYVRIWTAVSEQDRPE